MLQAKAGIGGVEQLATVHKANAEQVDDNETENLPAQVGTELENPRLQKFATVLFAGVTAKGAHALQGVGQGALVLIFSLGDLDAELDDLRHGGNELLLLAGDEGELVVARGLVVEGLHAGVVHVLVDVQHVQTGDAGAEQGGVAVVRGDVHVVDDAQRGDVGGVAPGVETHVGKLGRVAVAHGAQQAVRGGRGQGEQLACAGEDEVCAGGHGQGDDGEVAHGRGRGGRRLRRLGGGGAVGAHCTARGRGRTAWAAAESGAVGGTETADREGGGGEGGGEGGMHFDVSCQWRRREM